MKIKCVKCSKKLSCLPNMWNPKEGPVCENCFEIKDGMVFTSESGGYRYYDPSKASKKMAYHAINGNRELTYCPDSGGYWF